jgi:phosphatidylserine/phosphatidylglycerophosphate/cardiolipin synthase-like enzyme
MPYSHLSQPQRSLSSTRLTLRVLIASALSLTCVAHASNSTLAAKVIETLFDETRAITAKAPASAQEEFGFSPEGSARSLVLKFVNSTTQTLDIMAYGFTSQDITEAIVAARRRGVTVRLIVDEKANISDDRMGASQKALTRLVKAGAQVRTIHKYPIHHDKVMIADGLHLENGSFNFTAAAQAHNSENVSVRWNNPKAAAIFTQHFLSRWNQGAVFLGSF